MWRADNDTMRKYVELLGEYRQQIASFCFKHTRNADEAGELLCEVAEAIRRSIGTLRATVPWHRYRWLQQVMRHALADRRRRNRLHEVSLYMARNVPADDEADMEHKELVAALLEHLSDDERGLIQATMEGYTTDELAERHGVTRNVIHQRYRRIVMKLRTIYKQYYE